MDQIIIKGGNGKYPLRYWIEIGSEDKNKIDEGHTIISFNKETTTSTIGQEETSVEIRLVETDQPFLVAKPEEKEVIIVRKPQKTDIFISDQKLAKRITTELNKIKEKWAPSLWCTNSELTVVSALETMSKKKISGKIVPLIEKIMKDFYGDEN
jgi:hypothetical protein